MPIETLKDALSAGWRVHARCIDGKVDNTRSTAKCRYRAELDVETAWCRGSEGQGDGRNPRRSSHGDRRGQDCQTQAGGLTKSGWPGLGRGSAN